jgi:DNA polymerase-3 subunit alpha
MEELSKWAPTHQHSQYSILDGYSTSEKIANKCKRLGYRAAALTDHGTIAGCVSHFKECRKVGIKPLLGCEFYFSKNASIRDSTNRELSHVVILSKNLDGWYELMGCVSESNKPENFYFKPRIDYGIMKTFLGNGNHICITGHPGTELSNALFDDFKFYRAKTVEDARLFLLPDWKERALSVINEHLEIFGENLFIEIQLIDRVNLPASVVIAECLREIVRESNGKLKPVATADSHYVEKEDAEFQRILLASALNKTIPGIMSDLKDGKDVPLGTFFISDNYHIPTYEEIAVNHTEEEIYNSILIADMCEDYDIAGPPQLPHFACEDEYEHLTNLCRKGWNNLLVKKGLLTDENKEIYLERIKRELGVIKDAELSGYFLIVQDIMEFIRGKEWVPTTPGRGSAAGCLISYLIGITTIEPIKYDLVFERFYSAARKGSLPDIDLDVPAEHRDEVIQYIKDKYGVENVSQMVTYNSLMGRSALKEVLKVYNAASFVEMNEMTRHFPNEAEIADDLQESGESSIIMWSLKNRASKFEKWCQLDEEGNLTGEYSDYFRKAISIEGTKKSQGKHAAGVIISAKPLHNVCPMVRDKEGVPVAGFEMGDLELLGHVKFDILGVDVLSKVMKISKKARISIDELHDFDDPKTWDLLGKGDVKGIFQIERQKRWTRALQPRTIEHLSALIAIIRPGVADVILDGKSMTKHYIDRKNGDDEVTYLFPCLEPILNKTYGIMIYQEQALRIASEIAGFDLKEADALRKAIGKKLVDKMAELKDKFINGCVSGGKLNREDATTLFEWIEKSQKYLFNASHSFSYAFDAYYTLKCKAETLSRGEGTFYEIYLEHAKRKQDSLEEIRSLVNNAKLNNIEVHPPDLCNFNLSFTQSEEGNTIYFGISSVKDVGETECKKIFTLFETLDDPCNMRWMDILVNICDKINKKAVEALISVGALNGPSNKVARLKMLYEYGLWKMLTKKEQQFIKDNLDPSKDFKFHLNHLINNCKIQAKRLTTVISVFRSAENPPYDIGDNIELISNLESKYLGIALSCYKSDFLIPEVNATCKEVYDGHTRRGNISIGVEILSFREHVIAKGKSKGSTMAFIACEDATACLESVILFTEEYNKFKDLLFEGNTVIIVGEPSREKDGSFIVKNMISTI